MITEKTPYYKLNVNIKCYPKNKNSLKYYKKIKKENTRYQKVMYNLNNNYYYFII